MSPAQQSGKRRPFRTTAIGSLCLAPGNFVRPDEESIWKDFNAAFFRDFAPAGAVEVFLTTEIVRAAWRIRRCNNVEAALINRLSDPALDPMEDPNTIETQNAVDRARTQAEQSFTRSIAELRRIQTERQFRNEAFPEGTNLATFGVAGFKQILPAMRRNANADPFKAALAHVKQMAEQSEAELKSAIAREAATGNGTQLNGTPRNAPCPCGSGQKYKRCCGKNAPPVLGESISVAA